MIRGLKLAAQSLGFDEVIDTKQAKSGQAEFTEEEIPMMYRAQVGGRCSLQFAGNNADLEKWKDEWVDPRNSDTVTNKTKGKPNPPADNLDQPRYQKKEPPLGVDGNLYRIKVKFPFRLLSNCGQDSVIRPIMGKNGIPFISGSSVKGLFRRACNTEQIKKYCGFEDTKDKGHYPSTSGLRFHGAYPIGDWSGSHKVRERGQDVVKVRYRMLDVVHPQEKRQVGTGENQNATALTSVSLYKPTMIFEFSANTLTQGDWEEVENIFWEAIALGVGGKTSTGYGLGGYNDLHSASVPKHKFDLALVGQGVSPTLRSDEPEFRPNLFKASLRSHLKRLLGGVTKDSKSIDQEIDRLFGSSTSPGELSIFWQQQQDVVYADYGKTKTFKSEGILHLDAKDQKDVDFMQEVLKFAFVMGGFGKSWRRASHQIFLKSYKEFEIGCHWQMPSLGDLNWLSIKSDKDLEKFLSGLHDLCKSRFASNPIGHQSWREAWHPDRVTVYAKETKQSQVIDLFHDETFKTTPAIGGKNLGDTRPKFMSHVWHRMLPIGDGNYLEIVSVFHNDPDKWKHKKYKDDKDGEDQLRPFLDAIAAKDLKYVWGKEDPLQQPPSQPNKPQKRSK
jgi:CRISPR-associated protein Cmr6